MTVHRSCSDFDVDFSIHQLLQTAREEVGAHAAAALSMGADADFVRVTTEPLSARAGALLGLKATDGSELVEVLRVLLAAARIGMRVELSLGRPLSERAHRGLVRAGVAVRVETTDKWIERIGGRYDQIRVVGPERARVAVHARAVERVGVHETVLELTEVDVRGTGEIEALLHEVKVTAPC